MFSILPRVVAQTITQTAQQIITNLPNQPIGVSGVNIPLVLLRYTPIADIRDISVVQTSIVLINIGLLNGLNPCCLMNCQKINIVAKIMKPNNPAAAPCICPLSVIFSEMVPAGSVLKNPDSKFPNEDKINNQPPIFAPVCDISFTIYHPKLRNDIPKSIKAMFKYFILLCYRNEIFL